MKKITMLTVVFITVIGAAYSQNPGTFTVGGRAGGLIGFHEIGQSLKDAVVNSTGYALSGDKSKLNFSLAAYGTYAFADKLSVQAELNFMINQGMEASLSGGAGNVALTYTSVDIPVLVKYTFLELPALIGVQGGPYLSLPLGKMKEEAPAGFGGDCDISGPTFGLTAGLYAGYPLGPGRLVGDVRFLFDLSAVKAKVQGGDVDTFSRRGLVIGIGYEITL
jgi:hypothetical protein